MAGQVSNWVYKNIDKAYLVGSTPWSYNAVQDTQRDLWKHFSGTTLFKDKTVMLDNYYYNFELNSWSGLVLRPITGNNGWTAVCDFKLYEDDSKWKSSLQGIFGEYPILAAIRLIASGCGLTVTDVAWQNYLDDILEDVAGQLGITVSALRLKKLNTHIANVSGYNVAAYVDKHIVDMFIKAMHDAGMFEFTREVPEIIEPDTAYQFEPQETVLEMVERAATTAYNAPETAHWADMAGGALEFNLEHLNDLLPVSEITTQLSTLAATYDYDLEDPDLLGSIEFNLENRGSNLWVEFTLSCWKFKDTGCVSSHDYATERSDVTRYANWIAVDGQENYYDPANSCYETGSNRNFIMRWNLYEGAATLTQSTSSTILNTYIYQYMWDYLAYPTDRWSDIGTPLYYNTINFGEALIGPEGVTLQEGATPPKNSTVSSNTWSNWTGRAKTIYGDTSRSPASYTFIPLGYGDIDYYDQSRVQGGVVYSNYYLDLLGVTLEMIDDYEPGVDPDPGEDPDPIIPDPEPTPDPTPDDDEMEMTANRLFKVHQVTGSQVDALGGFIYSSTFIEAIKNMFTEPMDAIIGCFVLNYSTAGTLPIGTTETLKLGSVLGGTGVTGQPITNQFMTLDFGHKTINEYYGNVEDYAPYSKAECFLPYIGFVDLDINEIMNSTVNIKYVIDIYTGCCLAKIFVTKGGATQELYNFNGNCAIMVPLTGRDFTNGLMNFTTGAIGVIGGAVTGNPVAAVLGAKSAIGNISSIRRSGSISSNVGALGCQKPFILIKRPKAYNAPNYNQFYGYPSNWTVSLGSCSGYTRVKEVHLDHIICTDAEREEIDQLLHQGVIF